jgi:hypothetical protein
LDVKVRPRIKKRAWDEMFLSIQRLGCSQKVFHEKDFRQLSAVIKDLE